MAIDPLRLARIRTRLLAAAALALPACGTVPPHVNERAPEPPPKQVDGPINEHVEDKPAPEHINRPNPDAKTDAPPDAKHINRPNPDAKTDAPPDAKHINRPNPDKSPPKNAPTVQTINTPPPAK